MGAALAPTRHRPCVRRWIWGHAVLGEAKGKALVIHSDFESAGDGALTLVTTKLINTNDSDR